MKHALLLFVIALASVGCSQVVPTLPLAVTSWVCTDGTRGNLEHINTRAVRFAGINYEGDPQGDKWLGVTTPPMQAIAIDTGFILILKLLSNETVTCEQKR